MNEPQLPVAGWYPDPANPAGLRYWDGNLWTSHAVIRDTPAPASAPDPAPAAAPYVRPEPRTSPGVDTNTVWIWLIVTLPILVTLVALLLPWRSLFDYSAYLDPSMMNDPSMMVTAQFDMFFSPIWWIYSLLSYGVYGISVFFAYLDRKALLARGIDRPFHWAWAFLNPVYPIGRAIVAIRRTGRGAAPLWVVGASIVLGLVVGTIITAIAIDASLQMMRDLMLMYPDGPR